MIIEMITTIAGPDLTARAGQKIEMPEKKAVVLVGKGFARYCKESEVDEPPKEKNRKGKKPKRKPPKK